MSQDPRSRDQQGQQNSLAPALREAGPQNSCETNQGLPRKVPIPQEPGPRTGDWEGPDSLEESRDAGNVLSPELSGDAACSLYAKSAC